MKTVADIWKEGGGGTYTRKEPLYMKHFKSEFPDLDSASVIEVGPGTGRFAEMMFEDYHIYRYTIIDIPGNIEDSRKKLSKYSSRCRFITSEQIEDAFEDGYYMFISNVVLSETPTNYRESLLYNLLPKCEHCFIIDGTNDPAYNKRLIGIVKYHYDIVNHYKSGYKNCLVITGRKGKL